MNIQTMNIKEALFKLIDFCSANKIEYMVTGTTALDMLGVPSNPQDIDIKVFHLKEEQKAKLKELQFLSGLGNENYEESTCYSFVIGGVKINAIIDKTESYDEIVSKGGSIGCNRQVLCKTSSYTCSASSSRLKR
jgi:hypothetical protein|nr:MAG TPA: LnuA GENOMICS, ANTIBIOTIC RESISTANCE, CENTER [Caudoviricetes sp.]